MKSNGVRTMLFIASAAAFLALPFGEEKSITITLSRAHAVSLFDIIFPLLGLAWAMWLLQEQRWKILVSKGRSFWICWAIGAVMIGCTVMASGFNFGPSMVNPLVLGAGLILSAVAFVIFHEMGSTLPRALLWYSLIMLCVYVAVFYVIRCVYDERVLDGVTHNYLNYPFGCSRQTGLFIALISIIGAGCALYLRKEALILLLFPAATLTIGQTGSRSVMYLFGIAAAVFAAATLSAAWRERSEFRGKLFIYSAALALSVILGMFALDSDGTRSFTLFTESPQAILTGSADSFRGPGWRQILHHYFFGTAQDWETFRQSPYYVAPHNTFLEFLLRFGWPSVLLLAAFLASQLWFGLRSVVQNRNTSALPLSAAIFGCLIIVCGMLYGYPIVQVRYLWVFFGLAGAVICLAETRAREVKQSTIAKKSPAPSQHLQPARRPAVSI